MDEKRKGEIAVAALKLRIRKDLAFRDFANIKRDIGNEVLEPEFDKINATPAELLGFFLPLVEEVFDEQIAMIS